MGLLDLVIQQVLRNVHEKQVSVEVLIFMVEGV